MSNLILHPSSSNAVTTHPARRDAAEQTLANIVQQAEKAHAVSDAEALMTWVSFALMTGHLAFPVCVAIAALASLINAVAKAAFDAGLVDVQIYAQKRTSRDAAGLEGIYGVILDIDHAMPDVLAAVEVAGAPMPNVHWATPRPGAKLLYAA